MSENLDVVLVMSLGMKEGLMMLNHTNESLIQSFFFTLNKNKLFGFVNTMITCNLLKQNWQPYAPSHARSLHKTCQILANARYCML